ncbi:hypothetical protein [Paramixta manurensis]
MVSTVEKASGYTESDRLTYSFYTDEEIKNTPRISNNYYFTWQHQDGGKPEISSIVFSNTDNEVALKEYLVTLGYHHVESSQFGERWESERGPNPAFYLWKKSQLNQVGLSKTRQ